MAEIKDVVAFLARNYPFPDELSKARLTKMVYLADWEHAKAYCSQITNINWVFHNFGPYVDDVVDCVNASNDIFELVLTQNMYGGSKGLIRLKNSEFEPTLSNQEVLILKNVIDDTKTKYWDEFIKHVYDTYPIRVSDRHIPLNLIELAKQEKSLVAA